MIGMVHMRLRKISKLFSLFLFMIVLSGCSKELYCRDGYELKDEQCVSVSFISASREMKYYCLDGYYLIGDRCYQVNSASSISAYSYKTCISYRYYTRECMSYWTNYYCPNGYQLNGTVCTPSYVPAMIENIYTCPFGYSIAEGSVSVCMKQLYEEPMERFYIFK